MRVALAVTMTAEGYLRFGRRFINTFIQHWPKNCMLYVMAEKFLPSETADNLVSLDLETASPTLVSFKKQATLPIAHGMLGPGLYDYQLDAVKWCHRIFALQAVAEIAEADLLVNIDADIVTFADVPEDFVESLLPEPFQIAYLPRKKLYSECSFVVYKMDAPTRAFIREHRDWYVTGKVFELEKWTDCHIFDAMLPKHDLMVRNINADLPWSFHPFVNGPLGKYLDHLKGSRKTEGRSRSADLIAPREEEYWNA